MRSAAVSLALLLSLSTGLTAQISTGMDAQRPRVSVGMLAGYYSGVGFHANAVMSNLFHGFAGKARFGIGYSRGSAGEPLDARAVFINNNTNGVPEHKGTTWDFRLDMLYPVDLFSLRRAYAVGGVRYARFVGNFKYVGGNEDFDVKSNHWGLGAGLESYYRVGRNVDMILHGGFDYFFSSRLTGHDTSYSPDGKDVNAREDYTYDDADASVSQPKLEPRVLLGFTYNF